MLDRILISIEPFALTLIILAGANLAGWVSFSNRVIVGEITVFLGAMLIVKHVAGQVKSQKTIKRG